MRAAARTGGCFLPMGNLPKCSQGSTHGCWQGTSLLLVPSTLSLELHWGFVRRMLPPFSVFPPAAEDWPWGSSPGALSSLQTARAARREAAQGKPMPVLPASCPHPHPWHSHSPASPKWVCTTGYGIPKVCLGCDFSGCSAELMNEKFATHSTG